LGVANKSSRAGRRGAKGKSRREQRDHNRAEHARVPCCCARCERKGRRWPANYVGNGVGAVYAASSIDGPDRDPDGDVGHLVRGISYEDFLERARVYLAGHADEGGSGSTSSPSAAVIAQLEVGGKKLEQQTIKRDKRDEADARRARAQAERDGWRLVKGEWVRMLLPGGVSWRKVGERWVRAPKHLEGIDLIFFETPAEPTRCAA
jgi:hypothetical protein